MSRNPDIQTFNGIRVRGADTFDDWNNRQKSEIASVNLSWQAKHTDDVMIARYRVVEEGQVFSAPRLKKHSELYSEIKKNVEVPIIIGDVDEPGLPKSQNMSEEFKARVWELIEAHAEAIGLHAACTTRGGFHLLWVLDKPVTPEESEVLYDKLTSDLNTRGISLDTACRDWTRLVRAPDAFRNGANLSDSVPGYINKQFGHILTPDVGDVRVEDTTPRVELPMPEEGEVDPAWVVRSLNAVRNLASYNDHRRAILEGDRGFGEGLGITSRHDDMLKVVTWLVRSLLDAGNEPNKENLYLWLLPKAEQVARDGDQRTQPEELWRIIQWVVDTQIEDSEHRKNRAEQEIEELGGEETLKRTALVSPFGYFLLRKDGTYGSHPANRDSIYNELSETGMDDLAPTKAVDQQGRLKDVSKAAWLNRFSLTLHKQIYGTHEGGAIYDCVDDVRSLKVPLYVRPKLTPLEPTPEIAKWLDIISEEVTNGGMFKLHLAHLPTYWRAPCAAMGLLWPTGGGKSLLLDAVRQLVHEGSIGGSSCYGGFQDHLLKTPYLLIDEGFSSAYSGHSISDHFKEYATGGTLTVNPKGKPEVSISPVYPRQVFACESQELFSVLLTSSNKSDESLDATHARIRMYKTSSKKISDYLKQIGGERVTRTWTDPDNPLLTRAILWLSQEADAKGILHGDGYRFGVPEVEDTVLDKILLTSEDSTIVDHALALMVSKERDTYYLPSKETFFFRVEEVLEFIKRDSFLRTYSQCRTWTSRDIKRELRRMGPNVKRERPLDARRHSGYQIDPININYSITEPTSTGDLNRRLGYED